MSVTFGAHIVTNAAYGAHMLGPVVTKCRECKGHGWVSVDIYTRGGVWYSTATCPACKGTGRIQTEEVR